MVARARILAIDIGGVITKIPLGSNYRDDSFMGKDPLLIPKMEDSFAVIRELTESYQILLIARANMATRKAIAVWFKDQQFFESTGIRRENLFYTDTRDEKTGLALKHGVTHAIDDKLEVLGVMYGNIPNLIAFQASPSDKSQRPFISSRVTHADSWQKVREILLAKETIAA